MSQNAPGAPGGPGSIVPTKEELLRLFEEGQLHHPLHSHPYLDLVLDAESRDLARVRRFVEVVYHTARAVHECFFAICMNTDDELIRRSIIGDLYHEFGLENVERGHPFLMRRLLHSFGYSEFTPISLNVATQGSIEKLIDYCRREHPLVAVGCVYLGAAGWRSTFFRKVLEGFRSNSTLAQIDVDILQVRAVEDPRGHQRVATVVRAYLDGVEGRRRLHEGFLASLDLFGQLWSSMLDCELRVERTPTAD